MNNDLIPQGNDRIVCVKVGKVMRENLYEMTRKYWKVKLEKVSQSTHVLAVVDGVEAVYIPQGWKYIIHNMKDDVSSLAKVVQIHIILAKM